MRPAGAAADYDHLAVAAWIVPIMNYGVPHVICLLGIKTVVVDVVLPWKGMKGTVHFKMRRRQAIFNRYTHESILRKVLSNGCFRQAAAVATSVNYDRYAMRPAVVDVVDGRSNAHAINDFVGLNYARWRRWRRCWGLRFGGTSSAYQGSNENDFFHL